MPVPRPDTSASLGDTPEVREVMSPTHTPWMGKAGVEPSSRVLGPLDGLDAQPSVANTAVRTHNPLKGNTNHQ